MHGRLENKSGQSQDLRVAESWPQTTGHTASPVLTRLLTPSFSHSAHAHGARLLYVPRTGMAAKEKMRTLDPRPRGLSVTQFKFKGLERPSR